MKKIVLIPAYQPSEELLKILQELQDLEFTLIVVNDGSGAGYDSVFEQASEYATILLHAKNKGKGEALKTGIRYIQETCQHDYCIVTADADGQHRTADILRVCDACEQHPDSLILGSRKLNKNVPLRSKLGNSITRLVFHFSTGKKIYDTQTGLRGFTDKLTNQMLSIQGSRYEYEMNVLMELARKKVPMEEIWIETVYLADNQSSHFDIVKDSYRIYKEILKFSSSSILSFCIDYGLFCLLSALTGMLVYSNIMARVVSGSVNFLLNRKFVFQHQENILISAIKYFLLAVCILISNTLILKALVHFGMNQYLAKILTELVLFSLSWFVQHTLIFKKETKTK